MRALTVTLVATAVAGQGLMTPSARAQDPSDIAYDVSVMQRPLETQGVGSIRMGAWLLTPVLELGETYDDNIFATPDNTVDDFITTIDPVVSLASDWNRHGTEFEVGGNFGRYQDNPDENYDDYYFANSTVLDVWAGTQLSADLLYRHAHTPRTSAENIGASAEPLKFDQRIAGLGLTRNLGIFSLGVDGSVDRLTYSKSKAIGGGSIDNSERDRTTTDFGVSIGYEPFPESTASLTVGYQEVDYDDPTKFGGPDRDNTGLVIALNATKVISDLWVIGLDLGYHPRNFADSSLEDLTGSKAITLGADVLWNPTPITSVMATVLRQSYETTEPGASAVVSTFGALNVEHQLLRQLVLNAGLDYNFSDYDGADREDRDYGFTVGLQYALMRFVALRADYSYRERDSTDDTADYDKNIAYLGVRLSF